MFKEFKDFALRGNVLDLAVGVVIGAAFGAIVTSLVNDIVMPLVGRLLGGISFANLYLNFSDQEYASLEEAKLAGAAILPYGNFMQAVVNFLITAFAVFLFVRIINRALPRKAPAPAAPIAEEVLLLREIRDNLRR